MGNEYQKKLCNLCQKIIGGSGNNNDFDEAMKCHQRYCQNPLSPFMRQYIFEAVQGRLARELQRHEELYKASTGSGDIPNCSRLAHSEAITKIKTAMNTNNMNKKWAEERKWIGNGRCEVDQQVKKSHLELLIEGLLA